MDHVQLVTLFVGLFGGGFATAALKSLRAGWAQRQRTLGVERSRAMRLWHRSHVWRMHAYELRTLCAQHGIEMPPEPADTWTANDDAAIASLDSLGD